MTEIINLSDRRPPVVYEIIIAHHWDDRLEMQVRHLADDPPSREAVREALQRCLDNWNDGTAGEEQ